MPCKDITDTIKIQLDSENRFVRYGLRKKTCNGEVGRKNLLGKWLKEKAVDEILKYSPDDALKANPTRSNTWEYLTLKHFLSIKSALSTLVGNEGGGINDHCTIESVEYGPEGTLIIAHISVDGLTEEIEACGGCANCS